jgi:UDP-N-acetylglucosamine--N-acetylmuramyl-(pentapeptide) pyrophosphoryl-undecaprenol N-acetylglucosamine transferase
MTRVNVAFAGGGTGGHIYPGIAVREQLAASGLLGASLYLVSQRAIDAEILREQHLDFVATPARSPSLRPRALLAFLASWGKAVRASRAALRDLKTGGGPVVMVSTGGFVSAPAVQAARVERVPVVMLNLDAVPGRANRWIAGRAARVLSSARVANGWTQIPPIVRSAALPPGDPASCRRSLGLNPEMPVLLVTGASLGARSINRLLLELLRRTPEAFAGWQVLHQTGDSDAEALIRAYEAAGVPAIVRPFVASMGAWWGAAEIAVARCGAGLVAEAWASRTPAVFLPYPFHKDQHQRANALPLAEAGAAVVCEDRIDPGANAEDAGRTLVSLLSDRAKARKMREASLALGPVDGAARAASAVLEVAGLSGLGTGGVNRVP